MIYYFIGSTRLPDADEEAKSTTITCEQQLPSAPVGTINERLLTLEPPDWDQRKARLPEEPQASEVMKTTEKPRMLFGSKIVQWNDPDLPHIVLSVVCKIVSSPVILTSI